MPITIGPPLVDLLVDSPDDRAIIFDFEGLTRAPRVGLRRKGSKLMPATATGPLSHRGANGPVQSNSACPPLITTFVTDPIPGMGLSLDCGLFSDCDDMGAVEWTNAPAGTLIPGGGGSYGVVIHDNQVNDPVFGNLVMDGVADESATDRRAQVAEWDAGDLTAQNWCYSVYLARPVGNSPGGAPPSTEVGLEMENPGAPNNFVTLRVFVNPDSSMTSSVTTGANGNPAGGLQFVNLIDLGEGFVGVYRAYVTTTPTLAAGFQSIFWPQKTTIPTMGWIYAWGAQMVEGTLPQGPVRDPDTPGTEVTIVRPQTCAIATRGGSSKGKIASATNTGALVGGVL